MMIDDLLDKVPEPMFLTAIAVEFVDYNESRGERSMTRTLCILNNLFPDTGNMPLKIILRMRALASIWDHPGMYLYKEEAQFLGRTLVDDIIFKIAASHPLQRTETEITFDPKSFFAAIDRRTKMEFSGRGYYE